MKSKKTLIIILGVLAAIVIGIVAIFLYYYTQGSKDNYVPPEVEQIEAPVDQAVADMEKLASALETYYAMNFEYPESLAGLVPDVLDIIPKDPSTNQDYVYTTDVDENYSITVANPSNYHLSILKVENGEIIKK